MTSYRLCRARNGGQVTGGFVLSLRAVSFASLQQPIWLSCLDSVAVSFVRRTVPLRAWVVSLWPGLSSSVSWACEPGLWVSGRSAGVSSWADRYSWADRITSGTFLTTVEERSARRPIMGLGLGKGGCCQNKRFWKEKSISGLYRCFCFWNQYLSAYWSCLFARSVPCKAGANLQTEKEEDERPRLVRPPGRPEENGPSPSASGPSPTSTRESHLWWEQPLSLSLSPSPSPLYVHICLSNSLFQIDLFFLWSRPQSSFLSCSPYVCPRVRLAHLPCLLSKAICHGICLTLYRFHVV